MRSLSDALTRLAARAAGRRRGAPGRRLLLLAALLLPAACGDLPQPFRGRPGGLAGSLAQPPSVRIAVPRPGSDALLDSGGAERMADALANALRQNEVPATSGAPFPLDWRVTMDASQDGRSVTPRYRLLDADGTELGTVSGRAVPFRAWADASAATLSDAARYAGPRIAELLLRAEAQRRGTTAESLMGTAPRVYLASVRGATGDGNVALAAQVRAALQRRGMIPQENTVGAGFALTAQVDVTNSEMAGEQRVEIVWTVSRRDGQDLGRVVQINTVPARSLDRAWGDAASAAANEAAGGIRDVIRNAGGFPAQDPNAGREGGLTVPANASLPPPGSQPAPAAGAAPATPPGAAPTPPARRRAARPPARPAREESGSGA